MVLWCRGVAASRRRGVAVSRCGAAGGQQQEKRQSVGSRLRTGPAPPDSSGNPLGSGPPAMIADACVHYNFLLACMLIYFLFFYLFFYFFIYLFIYLLFIHLFFALRLFVWGFGCLLLLAGRLARWLVSTASQ